MKNASELFLQIQTALVVIERETETVMECFGELPAPGGEDLIGRDWRDALAVHSDSTAVISQSIKAGVSAALPPTVLATGTENDVVVGGMVIPQRYLDTEVVMLFLRRLRTDESLSLEDMVAPLDIVAVLGVDRLEFSPTWGATETDGLMMDLRGGLQQIVREEDSVGLPEGAAITVVLRGLDPEAALDICRALLSHLHQRLARQEGGAQYARACIGLSQRLEGQGALTAVMAANSALLQAQSDGRERIRFSSPWDPLAQAARALNAGGVFRDARIDRNARNYLENLVSVGLELLPPQAGLERIVELTLEQPGLESAALFRRDSGGALVGLCAATRADRDVRLLPVNKLSRAVHTALGKINTDSLQKGEPLPLANGVLVPIFTADLPWGGLVLQDAKRDMEGFRPDVAAMHYLGTVLSSERFGGALSEGGVNAAPVVHKMEKGIEGYVLDNMEGAIDQAVFLSRVDTPVAVVGPRGIGKMYIAQVIHAEVGGEPGNLIRIDCRSFRNRSEAQARLSRELLRGDGRTLVFKSPQLLHPDIQAKLARQLASRTVSDSHGIRYLPANRYIALFPESLEALVRKGELDERLASVFSGYPIHVPPLKERGRAVLRWGHKILEQESARLDRRVLGFTPDAEQVMLRYDWPGNISEMRDAIRAALARTEKEWITPVDLGIFMGISADGLSATAPERPFLEIMQDEERDEPLYAPSPLEELRLSLGQALAASMETATYRPLGAWLDDEIVLAASERFGNDGRGIAEFLHTRARNIGRWMPRIQEREQERGTSLLWQDTRKLVRQWILEAAPTSESPQQTAQDMLMSLVLQQCANVSVADRARIMGVSTPTYQKRLKQFLQDV